MFWGDMGNRRRSSKSIVGGLQTEIKLETEGSSTALRLWMEGSGASKSSKAGDVSNENKEPRGSYSIIMWNGFLSRQNKLY